MAGGLEAQVADILRINSFTRSSTQQALLLDWVLSVQFFRDNARSSFMRQEIAKKLTL
eukprot:COSAG06_NODE_37488_length_434_cov_1.549254_2_plen_57_part_01